jgi:hypothetical protein
MPRSNIPGAAPLLEELFDEVPGDFKPMGYLLLSPFLVLVGGNNAFPQIQRNGLSWHATNIPESSADGYSFI